MILPYEIKRIEEKGKIIVFIEFQPKNNQTFK